MNLDEKNKEAALGFLKISQGLADLAEKMDRANKNGEQIDIFAAFREATDIIKTDPDAGADQVQNVTETEQ